MVTPVLQARGLGKRYGGRQVLMATNGVFALGLLMLGLAATAQAHWRWRRGAVALAGRGRAVTVNPCGKRSR